MKAKRITALALTLALAAALGSTALAANENNPATAAPAQTPTMTMDGNGVNSSTKTEFTGTIVATKIKVTLPLTVAFNIDPTVEAVAGGAVKGQISQPVLTITNNSLVPIWIRVSNVAAASTTSTVPVLSQTDTTSTAKNMLFGLKTAPIASISQTADAKWLLSGVPKENYFLDDANGGKLAAGASISPVIYGKVGAGWEVGNKFTITPTFTVSVVKPA